MNDAQRKRFAPALQRVAGDEETLGMLAKIVAEDAPDLFESLDTHLKEESYSNAAKSVHALKGLLSTFETEEPVSELQPLIDAARQGDGSKVHRLYADVQPRLESLIKEITNLIV